ncbi:M20 family metallopeptidase [Candidatus Chloroploca sp. M-50]|uniref:M20 family metallopeptidase n=1 Tax=Candidatus Chloroploca mongolica TaxID=2528176 RepID=A0ABS4D5A0_9CHLR|nr:M20 family metallopeptidase [Candidatus Chloroploca mongolica]MBP1464602.1 M20 family metallopeptidase [Candidatus Chloroploca mongolica]
MSSLAEQLTAWLSARYTTYLEELRQLCAFECLTDHKPGVDQAGNWVRQWAMQRAWSIDAYPDSEVGDGLVVSCRGTGQLRVMLVAHLDTVYPVGTAAERPLRIEGDTLIGPGTADNKSGLLSGLYAIEALATLAPSSFGLLSLVCGGDEETSARASGAMLASLAPHYDLALVLEAGRENGDIVSARKGGGLFTVTVTGRAAHAGVEPEKGANAILALAHHILALQAMNGMYPGMTVNVGVIAGGSVPNTVPALAEAQVDLRITHPDHTAPVEETLQALVQRDLVQGTRTTLTGGWGFAPMARTPAIARLAELARSCASELGFALTDAATGGISYANLLAGAGLPVLDGLGPIGGLDHSPDEYIDLSSIIPRTALLALLIARSGEQ